MLLCNFKDFWSLWRYGRFYRCANAQRVMVCFLLLFVNNHLDFVPRNNRSHSFLTRLLKGHRMNRRLRWAALVNIVKRYQLTISLSRLHLFVNTSSVQPWLHSWPLLRIFVARNGIYYLLDWLNSLFSTYIFFWRVLFREFTRYTFNLFLKNLLLMDLLLSLLFPLRLLYIAFTSFVTIKYF